MGKTTELSLLINKRLKEDSESEFKRGVRDLIKGQFARPIDLIGRNVNKELTAKEKKELYKKQEEIERHRHEKESLKKPEENQKEMERRTKEQEFLAEIEKKTRN